LYRELEAVGGTIGETGAFWSRGYGVYPYSLAPLGYVEVRSSSLSVALEAHYLQAVVESRVEQKRTSLLSQLNRVIEARAASIQDLTAAIEAGLNAGTWQKLGDLLLAYAYSIPDGSTVAAVWDYERNALEIPLNSELSAKENAQLYFDRARKAKNRLGIAEDQRVRLVADRLAIEVLRDQVLGASTLEDLVDLEQEARSRKWLQNPNLAQTKKDDRPFEGHRIRTLLGPRGVTVLYGENSDANDYLTLRVAKSNDLWLHVRGNTSAHVIIRTDNQPDRIQRDQLEFAAKIAVQNSPLKHSGYVAVDYTLKKYVRKPRGAAKGTALYTHEKTVHIEAN
jgi:predicted ribosome quality control (RQC) complex YloA/Tae2 family protein